MLLLFLMSCPVLVSYLVPWKQSLSWGFLCTWFIWRNCPGRGAGKELVMVLAPRRALERAWPHRAVSLETGWALEAPLLSDWPSSSRPSPPGWTYPPRQLCREACACELLVATGPGSG